MLRPRQPQRWRRAGNLRPRLCGLLCGLLCAAVCAWAWVRGSAQARAAAQEEELEAGLAATQAQELGTAAQRRGWLGLPCLVLTLNASALHPSTATCTPFLGPRFSEAELERVSAEARDKLAEPYLLQRASDLTNNASVNIYMNHARMWTHIAEHWDAALVLEDDAVLPGNAGAVLQALLCELQRHNASNYVVKLHDLSTLYSEWPEVYDVDGHSVRRCMCRPRVHSAGTAAYVVDRAAAQTLLRHAYPASMHVDVFIHELGCIHQKIGLHGMSPMLMRISNRPSTHLSDSFQRWYLLLKEKIENMLHAEC
jgi:hypothetical protein